MFDGAVPRDGSHVLTLPRRVRPRLFATNTTTSAHPTSWLPATTSTSVSIPIPPLQHPLLTLPPQYRAYYPVTTSYFRSTSRLHAKESASALPNVSLLHTAPASPHILGGYGLLPQLLPPALPTAPRVCPPRNWHDLSNGSPLQHPLPYTSATLTWLFPVPASSPSTTTWLHTTVSARRLPLCCQLRNLLPPMSSVITGFFPSYYRLLLTPHHTVAPHG